MCSTLVYELEEMLGRTNELIFEIAINLGQDGLQNANAKGINVDQISLDGTMTTALMLAAKKGEYQVIELLLANGASPNYYDKKGCSALSYAIAFEHEHCAHILKNTEGFAPFVPVGYSDEILSPSDLLVAFEVGGEDLLFNLMMKAAAHEMKRVLENPSSLNVSLKRYSMCSLGLGVLLNKPDYIQALLNAKKRARDSQHSIIEFPWGEWGRYLGNMAFLAEHLGRSECAEKIKINREECKSDCTKFSEVLRQAGRNIEELKSSFTSQRHSLFTWEIDSISFFTLESRMNFADISDLVDFEKLEVDWTNVLKTAIKSKNLGFLKTWYFFDKELAVNPSKDEAYMQVAFWHKAEECLGFLKTATISNHCDLGIQLPGEFKPSLDGILPIDIIEIANGLGELGLHPIFREEAMDVLVCKWKKTGDLYLSPLYISLAHNMHREVKMLLGIGADPNENKNPFFVDNNGFSKAVDCGSAESLRVLMDARCLPIPTFPVRGVTSEERQDWEFRRLICSAGSNCFWPCLKVFHDFGFDIFAPYQDGLATEHGVETFFHAAANRCPGKGDTYPAIRLPYEDPNFVDMIHWAASLKEFSASYLNHICTDIYGNNGQTALHVLCEAKQSKAVLAMIEHGANLNQANDEGSFPDIERLPANGKDLLPLIRKAQALYEAKELRASSASHCNGTHKEHDQGFLEVAAKRL